MAISFLKLKSICQYDRIYISYYKCDDIYENYQKLILYYNMVLLIALSNILLSYSAQGMGEYKIAAWQYIQSLFAHFTLFWSIGILLLIQVLLINLKLFKYKNRIVACITIAIIIVSVIFYRNITKIIDSYNTII